ncbi:DUF6531 domain-containing protein [Flavobacterium procerum]|uniref:DUF6531 domain-containing protein n=1 Tax=Flavobacterium procerum TaxID=1455569 RepID=UPI0035EECC66
MAEGEKAADKNYFEKVSEKVNESVNKQVESVQQNNKEIQNTLNNDKLSPATKTTTVLVNAAKAINTITSSIDTIKSDVNKVITEGIESVLMPLLKGLGMKGQACLPISKQLDPVLGIDIHMVTIPPSPAPVPMPHPYIGLLFRPKDFLSVTVASLMPLPPEPPPVENPDNPTEEEQQQVLLHEGKSFVYNLILSKLGATVKIGDFAPRAVASTPTKSIPHFPMGAGFHPVYSRMCSKNNGHALLGSLLALADGDPISGGGAHLHNSCQDVGIFSPHTMRPTKNKDDGIKMGLELYLPTSVIIPIPPKGTIITNPIPAPFNPVAIVKKLLLNGFAKFAKKIKGRLIKFNHSGKCPRSLKRVLCRLGFEPINLVNGAVIYEGSDFDIAGPLALNWTRQWYSDSPYIGWLGHGVHCNYDRAVELYPELGTVGLRMDDGRIAAFPELQLEGQFYLREEKITLKRTSDGYQAYDYNSRLFYDFTLFDGRKYQLTKISNPDGLALVFEFEGYRLTKIIEAAGRVIKVSTKNGFIEKLELESPEGLELLIAYEYDELYNMTAIIDALGNPTRIEYDKNLMVKKTDRNGQAFYWEYDSQNRCTHTWGDGGWQEGWMEYHPQDGYNLVTDANQAVTTYYYDANQLVTEIEDPMGNSVFYDYTEYMELYREIDQEGRVFAFVYDEKGNKTTTIYPDGTEEMTLYDDENRPFISIDPEGEKTVFLYEKEKAHQLKTIIAPDKSLTNFTYNEQGMLHTIAKNSNELELVYDKAYNLIEWRENGQKLKTWEYDYRGRVRAIYTPMQMADYFTYDALDRVQKIIEKDSNVIEFDL